MKWFFLFALTAPLAHAANEPPTVDCQNTAMELNSALQNPNLQGLALDPYMRELMRACRMPEKVYKETCHNDEPGTAYYSYKASCLLNHIED